MLRNTFLLEFQLNPLNGLKEGVANFELSLIIWCTHLVSTPASCPENTFISGGETKNTIHFSLKRGGTKNQTKKVAQNT